MPNTLKEWMWIGLLLCAMLYPSFSKADEDLLECLGRGRAAFVMVMGVATGIPLDHINVYFQFGNQFVTDEQYVNGVREEVRSLLGIVPTAQTPEAEAHAKAIGNKVAEACAYQMGKQRTNFQRMGSARPPGKADRLLQEFAASSQSLAGPPIGMEQFCSDLKYDIATIARAISDDEPQEKLKDLATRSSSVLSEARLTMILQMIDKAYAHKGPIVEWMNREYSACMGNR